MKIDEKQGIHFMRWPLRRQILLPMVGILLLTIGVVSALNAWLASGRVRRQIETQLADVAQTLAASNFPLEAGVLKQTRGLTGAEYVVADSAGLPVAASDEALLAAAQSHGPAARRFDLSHTVLAGGRTFFHAVVPLDRRSVGGGKLVLHVFYPESTWREARWQAATPPLAIGGVVIPLVALVAYAIALRVTLPIQQLKTQVEKIAQGDFQPMPSPERDDEVKELVAAVNQMAEKLARYEQEIRQSERLRTLGTLGGGIAHQVRNAATGCRIALDLHQRDCPIAASNGHAEEEPLAVAVRQLELIETHVQRLLALGRPAATVKKPLDLAEVMEHAVSLVRPMAEHVGVSFTVEPASQPLAVTGDAAALVQLLVNLLVNGVQATSQAAALSGWSDPQAKAAVVLRAQQLSTSVAQLAVGDSGPGPAEEIRERLFQPFATDKPGGTGLGLVVARQIAEDHGGRITWQRMGSQTWFLVELPLVSSGVV